MLLSVRQCTQDHDWKVEEDSYVFEPPGETHTLVVPDDVSEMISLFHITGAMIYVDPYGKQTGYEDSLHQDRDVSPALRTLRPGRRLRRPVRPLIGRRRLPSAALVAFGLRLAHLRSGMALNARHARLVQARSDDRGAHVG